jgi:hypothetical protein
VVSKLEFSWLPHVVRSRLFLRMIVAHNSLYKRMPWVVVPMGLVFFNVLNSEMQDL